MLPTVRLGLHSNHYLLSFRSPSIVDFVVADRFEKASGRAILSNEGWCESVCADSAGRMTGVMYETMCMKLPICGVV